MNYYHRSLALMAAILVCSFLKAGQSQALQFQGLGSLPGTTFQSIATGISADGSTVVGRADTSTIDGTNSLEAFQWTAGQGMLGLDESGTFHYSEANAVSFDGSAVVGAFEVGDGLLNAYYWTRDLGRVLLHDSPTYGFSLGTGISADGSVIVGFEAFDATLSGTRAVRWTETGEQLLALGDLGGGESRAFDVSADGSVIVGVSKNTSGKDEAFHWTPAEGMFGIGSLEGYDSSRATAVSADGSTIVGSVDSETDTQAFLWNAETGVIGLGDLAGGEFHSTARDVSADGSIVVGSSFTSDGEMAFIWDGEKGMQSIRDMLETDYASDLNGWILLSATGISDDGSVITGYGINPEGYQEAWRIDTRAVPIPSNMWLMVTGVIGIAAMRLKRKSGNNPG